MNKNTTELERSEGCKIVTGNAKRKSVTIKNWERSLPLRAGTCLFNISVRQSECMNLT